MGRDLPNGSRAELTSSVGAAGRDLPIAATRPVGPAAARYARVDRYGPILAGPWVVGPVTDPKSDPWEDSPADERQLPRTSAFLSGGECNGKASQQLVARNEESPSPEDEVQGFFQFKDEDAVLLWSSKSNVPIAEGTVEVKSLSEEEECRVHNTVLKVGEVLVWVRKVLVPDTRIHVNTN
eukprot:jgi/Chlat1/8152/Chrsp76S07606